MLNGGNRFARKYTDAERDAVENYMNSQLDKIDLPDITTEEREYLRTMMLTMYANPLKNKLKTILGGIE